MTYTAAVIGLGNIGMCFDLKSKPAHILTHTKAYLTDKRFDLQAGVDINAGKRKTFESFSGKKAYASTDALCAVAQAPIDVISLCTPENVRLSEFKKLLPLKPRLVIIEKPIALSVEEAVEIRHLARRQGVRIFVNYIRRADPFFREVRRIVGAGELGRPLLVSVRYSGGLYKNASHFIDLMLYYFGEPRGLVRIKRKERKKGDCDCSFTLCYDGFDVHFQDVSDRGYSTGELDFFFSAGRITVADFGARARVFTCVDDPVFRGFTALRESPLRVGPQLHTYQRNVLEHVYRVLEGKENPVSDADSALATARLCARIDDGRYLH